MELKANEKAKRSALQEFELSCIQHQGKGIGLVVYPENLEEKLEIIKKL